jgi:hypothetical protein
MELPRVLISLETDGSREVKESPEAFPAICAQARFAGCTFMRHIILFWQLIQFSCRKLGRLMLGIYKSITGT